MIGLVWSFLSSVTAENDHVIDCDFQATPLLMLTRWIYLDTFAFNENKKSWVEVVFCVGVWFLGLWAKYCNDTLKSSLLCSLLLMDTYRQQDRTYKQKVGWKMGQQGLTFVQALKVINIHFENGLITLGTISSMQFLKYVDYITVNWISLWLYQFNNTKFDSNSLESAIYWRIYCSLWAHTSCQSVFI